MQKCVTGAVTGAPFFGGWCLLEGKGKGKGGTVKGRTDGVSPRSNRCRVSQPAGEGGGGKRRRPSSHVCRATRQRGSDEAVRRREQHGQVLQAEAEHVPRRGRQVGGAQGGRAEVSRGEGEVE